LMIDAIRILWWNTVEYGGGWIKTAQDPMMAIEDCWKSVSYLAELWSHHPTTSSDVQQRTPRYSGGHWWPPMNFPPAGILLPKFGTSLCTRARRSISLIPVA
jgi:hypothetical protein